MVPCLIDTYSLNRYSLVRAARAGTQAASDGGGAAASSGGGGGGGGGPGTASGACMLCLSLVFRRIGHARTKCVLLLDIAMEKPMIYSRARYTEWILGLGQAQVSFAAASCVPSC